MRHAIAAHEASPARLAHHERRALRLVVPSDHGKDRAAHTVRSYDGGYRQVRRASELRVRKQARKLAHRYFSIAKAQQILGYQPVTLFEDGWKETVEAIKRRMELGSAGPAAEQPSAFLSSNLAKRDGERFFLAYAVAWISLMVWIVYTRAFASFSPMQYLYVGLVIAVPCVLLPLVFPSRNEQPIRFYNRYSFKHNVWCFILSFYGLWCWQIYFYTVLCTRYTFSPHALRFNNVPITLFLITQGYFTFYFTMSDAVLRRYWNWAGWGTGRTEAGHRYYPRQALLYIGYAVYIGLFSYVLAFMETFTIQHFEPYEIHDRRAMYIYGSVFYALYFVVACPMHFGIDESKGTSTSLGSTIVNAFASCGMVTLLLDMYRIALGPIVLNCPFPEARTRSIPFIEP